MLEVIPSEEEKQWYRVEYDDRGARNLPEYIKAHSEARVKKIVNLFYVENSRMNYDTPFTFDVFEADIVDPRDAVMRSKPPFRAFEMVEDDDGNKKLSGYEKRVNSQGIGSLYYWGRSIEDILEEEGIDGDVYFQDYASL